MNSLLDLGVSLHVKQYGLLLRNMISKRDYPLNERCFLSNSNSDPFSNKNKGDSQKGKMAYLFHCFSQFQIAALFHILQVLLSSKVQVLSLF